MKEIKSWVEICKHCGMNVRIEDDEFMIWMCPHCTKFNYKHE